MRELTKSEDPRERQMKIFLGQVVPDQKELDAQQMRHKLRKFEEGRLHSTAAYCHSALRELTGEERAAFSRMTVAELANVYADIESPDHFEKFPVAKK